MEHKFKIPNLDYLRLLCCIILLFPLLVSGQKSVNGDVTYNSGQPLSDVMGSANYPLRGKVTTTEGNFQNGISADTQTLARTTILLVDDHHILYRSGTKRSLNQLSRFENNPVIPQTEPWELTIAYCSVHRDERTGNYELWYQAFHTDGNHLAYATSDDGISWKKPSLGLIEFNGNKNNNLVMPIGYGGSVIFDPHEKDSKRRYKCAFWSQDKKPYGMHLAFSPDGIHWTKHENNPVIKGSYGAPIQPPYKLDEN